MLPNRRRDEKPVRLVNQLRVAVPPERHAFRVRLPSGSPGFVPASGATRSRNRPHRAPRPGLTPTGTPMSSDRGFRRIIGSHRHGVPDVQRTFSASSARNASSSPTSFGQP